MSEEQVMDTLVRKGIDYGGSSFIHSWLTFYKGRECNTLNRRNLGKELNTTAIKRLEENTDLV